MIVQPGNTWMFVVQLSFGKISQSPSLALSKYDYLNCTQYMAKIMLKAAKTPSNHFNRLVMSFPIAGQQMNSKLKQLEITTSVTF